MIARLVARITELEALVGKMRKNSSNSHQPPSQDGPGWPRAKGEKHKARNKPRPSRPGMSRSLAAEPDRTEQQFAEQCPHCETSVTAAAQRRRHGYDHIDLPVIRPVVTRMELFGGRCRCCGQRYRAAPPVGMVPGTPFGPGIRSLLAYLHHTTMSGSSGCRGCWGRCSGCPSPKVPSPTAFAGCRCRWTRPTP